QLTTAAKSRAQAPPWQCWLGRQSAAARLRGWASALRHNGIPPRRAWTRWARLAAHATPRHCLYEAATELLFRRRQGGALARAAALLPLPPPLPPVNAPALALAVLANYQRLVASTRA
ncbi:MAG: hypothetical protein ACRD1F_01460, partial [Terriglobales bacterium]